MALYVARIVSFCFPHVVDLSICIVLCAFVVVISMCLIFFYYWRCVDVFVSECGVCFASFNVVCDVFDNGAWEHQTDTACTWMVCHSREGLCKLNPSIPPLRRPGHPFFSRTKRIQPVRG